MRAFLAALLVIAFTLALAAPGLALERGIVYSKVQESEEQDVEGQYGPATGGLYTLHGERPFRVTYDPADSDPNVSRNGTIAFVRGGDVYLVGPDRSGLRQLTSGPEIDERPLFAPDGRSLVFSRRVSEGAPRDLYLVRLDGSPPVALTSSLVDESEASFSSGGAEMAYVSSGDLYSLKLKGGAARRLTATPEQESAPHYFVGGILFNRPRTASVRTTDIYRMPREGGKALPVVAKKAGARIAGVTPDGNLLAFLSRGNYWSKQLFARGGLAPRKLSGAYGGGELAMSPNGRLGAFLLYFDEDFAIEAVNLRTGGFVLSADLYRLGDGISIGRQLAW